MKRNICFVALVLLILAPITTVNAAVNASNTPPYRLGKPFKEIREEYREKVLELKASTSERKLIRRDWVMDKMEALTKRLNDALERSRQFIERIESFIDSKKDEGRDFTAVKNKLVEAESTITTGQNKVDEIMTSVKEALATSTPRSEWPQVKETVSEAVAAVKAAHQKVVEAVRLLKN